jgi:hypothetical protein
MFKALFGESKKIFVDEVKPPFALSREVIDRLEDYDVTEGDLRNLELKLIKYYGLEKVNRLIRERIVEYIILELLDKGFRGTNLLEQLEHELRYR